VRKTTRATKTTTTRVFCGTRTTRRRNWKKGSFMNSRQLGPEGYQRTVEKSEVSLIGDICMLKGLEILGRG
jgi:hypothetical protein